MVTRACLQRAVFLSATPPTAPVRNAADSAVPVLILRRRLMRFSSLAPSSQMQHQLSCQESPQTLRCTWASQQSKKEQVAASDNNKSQETSSTTTTSTTTKSPSKDEKGQNKNTLPPPPPPVDKLLQDIERASLYNQGNTRTFLSKRRARQNYFWDSEFCRKTADAYQQYLISLADDQQQKPTTNFNISKEHREVLLSPQIVDKAIQVLLRSRLKPNKLSAKIRDWERALGTLAVTPLTDSLSMRLLEANGKAGNIGRTLSLLEFRTSQSYKPTKREYILAITAVEAAGWYLRQNRNIYLGDHDQPVIDNPTRWLDAILMNMHQRHFPLTTDLAVRMLDTYASRGRSGKALHYFYSVHKTPYHQRQEEGEDMDTNIEEDDDSSINSSNIHDNNNNASNDGAADKPQPRPYDVRIKMKMTPPYYKVPTDVKGKLLTVPSKQNTPKKEGGSRKQQQQQRNEGVLKIDRESEPDWSLPLTALFSFADSLTHGVLGHDPIELNVVCYNVLIKACVYRGALWRAMHLLDTAMPSAGITPNVRTYDTLLSGLARVGDVTLMRDYYQRMISKGIEPSFYTVQCIIDGLLNLGDVAGAVTVVQDFFNQHSVLPPVESQLKILEFALAQDMPYEAKRHVYFIQQLWKWQPHYKYESKEYIYSMKTYQQDPRISKEALQHLFGYFGEDLEDDDFF